MKSPKAVNLDRIWSVVIVGGGAAGLFAASKLVTTAPVLILEKGKECGRKLLLTGGGRCNITHDATVTELLSHYHGSPRFLTSALHRYDPVVLRSHFLELGLATKVDSEGRVFPRSEKAEDVRDALLSHIRKKGYLISYESEVIAVKSLGERTARWCLSLADGREVMAENVIFAGGGASYPGTGSNGKLGRVLGDLGVETSPFSAALTDLRWLDAEVSRDFTELSGLTLKNIRLSLKKKGSRESVGDLLITHRGLSGPAAINLSADLADEGEGLVLNLFPGENPDSLLVNLLRYREEKAKMEITNLLATLLASRFAMLCCNRYWPSVAGKRVADLSMKEWRKIAEDLTRMDIPTLKKGKLVTGMVCRGGVKTKEVNPKTMEIKTFPGLYVCGELLDIDGDTGGYNLQAAFSTACAAADSLSI